MKTLLQILAVLAAIALIVATSVVILLRPCAQLALRAQVYKDVLARERFLEQVPRIVGETLRVAVEAQAREAGEDGGEVPPSDAFAAAVRELTPQDWEMLIGGALPAELLRAEVEKGLDAAEKFLREDVDGGPVAISLVEVKQRLSGAPIVEAYAALLSSRPPCTPQQWEASMGLPVVCRPSPDQMATALEMWGAIAAGMAEELPDAIPLVEGLWKLAESEEGAMHLEQVRRVVRRVDALAWWSPAVPVVLAGLVLILVVRSFRGLLLWWGIPCVVAGTFSSFMALGLISMGAGMVSGIASADLPAETPVALISAIFGLGSAFVRALFAPALAAGLVLAAIGLGALVVAFLTRPRAAPPPLVPV